MSEQIPSDLGEQTKAQSPLGVPWYGYDTLLWGNGGSCGNPCGFPNYGSPYARGYWTYRWMLQHPVIRLVRSIATAPIIASTWDYKKADDDVPDGHVDLVRRNFDPLRRRMEEDALRGRDYGWAGFEPIWDIADGEYRLTELKALSHEMTSVVADDNGRFTGLSQGGLKATGSMVANDPKRPALPAPFKAWLYTYDRECGNLHGRSWLENLRETAWKDWLDCAQQLQKLGAKISGTQAIIKSPPDMKDNSIALVKAIGAGATGGWLPNMAFDTPSDLLKGNPIDGFKLLAQLTKVSLTDLQVLDFGSTAPAIAGLLERQKHNAELMFAGGLRSSRTGLEGQHGTKAEAQTHTDTGVIAAELDDDDIAAQVQPLVDALLVLNFGADAAGTVRIDPPPLVDAKSERAQAVLTLASQNTPMAKAIARVLDMDRLLKDMEAPLLKGVKFVMPEDEHPDPNVPVNGNGRKPSSPRVAAAARRFAEGN